MNTIDLKNKRAVVTGGAQGFGLAITKRFIESGARVAIWDNDEKVLQNVEVKDIHKINADVTSYESVTKATKLTLDKFDSIDILVNNAGVIHTSLFQMTPVEKIKEVFDINYFSTLLFTQYIVKKMAKKIEGSIVNISSSSAIEANEGRIAYASSKAALITSTKVIAKELGRLNIRVNAIAPGLTDTDMMRDLSLIHI